VAIELKAMVIVGAQGTGKSTAARKAAALHGRYVETTYQELRHPFGLGRALASQPDALIVDEMPASRAAWDWAKALITELEPLVHQPLKAPFRVRAPCVFIFIAQDMLPVSPDRRFEILEAEAIQPEGM
jgi:hypothetical protein